MQEQSRAEWQDFLKGLAIILVIIGHLEPHRFEQTTAFFFNRLIYSFHMPMFFILSGYNFKPARNFESFKQKIKSSFKNLIGTTLLIFLLRFIIDIVFYRESRLEFVVRRLVSLIFASGAEGTFLGFTVPALGMMWFLVVLFLMRAWIDFLFLKISNENKRLIIILATALLGVKIGKQNYLPLSLDLVLSVSPIYLLGYYIKTNNLSFRKHRYFLIVLWILLFGGIYYFSGGSLQLAGRGYPYFPLSYFGAVAASLGMIEFAKSLNYKQWFNRYLVFIGKNSLLVFSIHALDSNIMTRWVWNDSNLLNASIRRVVFSLICLQLIVFIKNQLSNKKNIS